MPQLLLSKTVAEAQVVSFDFSGEREGTLSGGTVAKSVITGTDPSAASLTLSAPVTSGSAVSTLVSGGTDEVSYELLCLVNDSTGEVHTLAAILSVINSSA